MKVNIQVDMDLPLNQLLKEVGRALNMPATATLLEHYEPSDGFTMEQPKGKIIITKQ
jgi:hypothetical protein